MWEKQEDLSARRIKFHNSPWDLGKKKGTAATLSWEGRSEQRKEKQVSHWG